MEGCIPSGGNGPRPLTPILGGDRRNRVQLGLVGSTVRTREEQVEPATCRFVLIGHPNVGISW